MVVSIVITIFGVVSASTLPISQYPNITPAEIKVEATYTGANAVAVEQSVATPLEQKINGVENMIYVKSVNSGDGKLSLTVSFDVGSDLDNSNVLVQNRVSEGTSSLPEEAKRLGVTVKKSLTFPLMLVTLRSPNNTFDNNFLTNYATINIIDEIARISGVGQVTTFGGSEYAMRVWVKPDRLAKLGLTVPDITRAIQEQNIIAPAGKIGAPPAPPGTEFTYAVQTQGRLETESEFENVIVRSNPDGSQVLLKDVARVELGAQIYNSVGRLNGSAAAILAIYQLPGSNGLEVANEIRATMDRIAERFPSDIKHSISLDTTRAIEAGIDEIIVTLFEAIGLVILVVYLFLQSARATLIPLVAIPVSLVGTFTFFPLLGFSINTISLLGLVLAIGTVVDDAIVVVEAVTLNMSKGMSPKEATLKTMEEVSGAIVATSLTLAAVFVPVAFMGGITGRLYQQFAITIAISVLFSSVNALTLSPALAALVLKPESENRSGLLAKFFDKFNSWLESLTAKYVALAGLSVRNLRRSMIFLVLIVLCVVLVGSRLPTGFVPEEDQGYILANVQLPDAASLERTDQVCRKIEAIMSKAEGIESYSTVVGFSLLSGAMQTNNAFFFIELKDWGERGEALHAKEITRRLSGAFAKEIPEAIAFAFGPPAIPGLGTGSGFSMMLQDRGGNTPQYLEEQTQRFIQAARTRPEIANAFTTFRAGVPQIFADIDRSKVLKLGVNMSDVNTALGSFLGGAYVNDFNRFGRLYKVYVQAEPEYRISANDLGMFFVRGKSADQMVPLSTLITTKRKAGPEFTNRFNLFRAAEVSGAPAPGYSSTQALNALEEVAAEVLPSDMTYAWNAMSYQEKAASGSGASTFVFALLFVFLILAAQYESWSLPFSVLLGTPFAVLGAYGGLYLCRIFSESYVNNVFAQIGLVLLIGLAAKNAILIVEFARQLTHEGLNTVDAALEAARLRFRPILMTAFSFILGVLPLLTATGAGAEARKVMGMTEFAGMMVATVLGICLVPVLFVFIERARGADKEKAVGSQTEERHAANS